MKDLSAPEVFEYLKQVATPPLLLDVREAWEYEKVHLPGSQLIPMRQIPAAIAEMDKEQEIVVICHHGIRSRAVGQFLEHNGFQNVINLHGGIDAWARDVDESMPVY